MMTKELSSTAQAAAAIRKELKKEFPMYKFSVVSECFSGGDAVRVRYYDGPTVDKVRAIVDKYAAGHFDGMQDLYIYDRDRNLPTAKYVTIARRESNKYSLLSLESARELHKQYDNIFTYVGDIIRCAFNKSDIDQNARSYKIVRIDGDAMFREDFFKVLTD